MTKRKQVDSGQLIISVMLRGKFISEAYIYSSSMKNIFGVELGKILFYQLKMSVLNKIKDS
jgi:hypothetical protein